LASGAVYKERTTGMVEKGKERRNHGGWKGKPPFLPTSSTLFPVYIGNAERYVLVCVYISAHK